MEKYLITGEIYDWKKSYALFSNGEYFICNINRLKLIDKPDDNDSKAIEALDNDELKSTLIQRNDNYYISQEFEDNDGNKIIISNIKCFKNPTMISYEYEHYKSLYPSN